MIKTSIFAGTALLLLCPVTAFAQDAEEQGTYEGDIPVGPDNPLPSKSEIVVTASGIAQNRTESGMAITTAIVEERPIPIESTSITDVLRTLPSLAIAQSGPVGAQTSVFIRGGESSQTLVLIDGVRINDPSSPNAAFDFGALLTGNIDRVEVLRGANSVIWGSQAIGGVIDIRTAKPSFSTLFNARAEYGSHNSAQGWANISGTSGIFSGSLGGGYYRTDGISALAGGTEKDGYRNFSANGKLGIEISPAFSLDLRAYYNKGRVEYDDAFGFPVAANTVPVSDNEQFVGYVGLNHDLIDGKWVGKLSYSRTDLTREGTEAGATCCFNYNTFTARGIVDRFAYDGGFDLSRIATLVFGAAHERTFASTFYPLGGDFAPNTAQTDFNAVYGQLTLKPVNGLTLNGGARYEDNSQYGGHTSFAGNFAYSPNGGTTVFRGSYAEGFRAPTLTEALPPYGNAALKPETSQGFDVGIEHHFLDEKVTASATWFTRKSDNAIIYSFATFQSENIAKVEAQGVELDLTIRPEYNLTLIARYSLVDATSRTPDTNFGHRLARRPKDSASFMLDWKSPWDLSLGSTLTITGDSFDNLANTVRLDSFWLASLRAAYPVTDNFEIYARVENLFDEDYQTVAGYNSYGRTAAIGVRVKI